MYKYGKIVTILLEWLEELVVSYQSEAQLERSMYEQLIRKGYEPVVLSDYAALVANFRQQVNKFNEKKLEDTPMSDAEFTRLMTRIDKKSVFESAQILRDKVILQRDDGSEVYLELFNTREWCQKLFQVTTQTTVKGKYVNRYDVTLLINGLPVFKLN